MTAAPIGKLMVRTDTVPNSCNNKATRTIIVMVCHGHGNAKTLTCNQIAEWFVGTVSVSAAWPHQSRLHL